MIEKEKIIAAVKKTGFDLEYFVYKLLRENKWQVINNRYYLDDLKGIEREIDAVAYKVKHDTTENILYYTVLIISCKKNDEHNWVFLTHDMDEDDPNFEFCPIENFTNDVRLSLMLKKQKKSLTNSVLENSSTKKIYKINHKVFAFQQISKDHYKLGNDKDIYDSIITTIKALEYEKNIKNNKGNHVFYNFNLLSIFDGEMIETYFNRDEKLISNIQEIKYINRHIIDKNERFYRVHFITKKCLERLIKQYNNLHALNLRIYPKLIQSFYEKIFEDKEKVELFWDQFTDDILFWINYNLRSEEKISNLSYYYNDNLLTIEMLGFFNLTEKDIEKLNSCETTKKRIQECLKKYFRYTGGFVLKEGLPF